MKIIEFHLRIIKIMKVLEFHLRITKIMKHFGIQYDNYKKKYKNNRISIENNENH